MTDSFVKSIIGVTFVGKCTLLMYMIFLTYCFPFFSVIATLFDVASCIFKLKLKNFNCSNSFVPLPFIKLSQLGHGLRSHMEIVKRCIYNNLFGDDHTNEFIDLFRICVSLITLYSYHGLFYKVRACVRFFRKRAKKWQKMLKKGGKKGKIFENLGRNIQNLKIF